MAGTSETLSNLTQSAQDIASNASESALLSFNDTEGWLTGPDGEFDGDPEEPRFAVLVFYCILVRCTQIVSTSRLQWPLSYLVLAGSHGWSTKWALLLEEAAQAKLRTGGAHGRQHQGMFTAVLRHHSMFACR